MVRLRTTTGDGWDGDVEAAELPERQHDSDRRTDRVTDLHADGQGLPMR